jgi:CheY-like chemotaxis protein
MSDQNPDPKRQAVLVVDDSRVIRVALQRILQGERSVYEAGDGEQALEVLQQSPDIGLVLTDLSMPGIDGQDLLLRIRDGVDAVPADLPVVIVTGQENDAAASDGWRSLGANDVLMKPFIPSRVREVVAELLPAPAEVVSAGPESEDTEGLRAEVERLRQELMLRQQSASEREAQKELQRLHVALGEARDEATAAFQRAEEGEQRATALQERLAEMEPLASRSQELEKEAQLARDTAEKREHELNELRERVRGMESERGDATEVETLRNRVREFESENVRLDHELVELDRQREAVQKELAQAHEKIERLRRERNEQCERAADAEKAQAELDARRAEGEQAVADLNRQLETRQQELEEAQRRNHELRGRVRELENALSTTEKAAAVSAGSVDATTARGEGHGGAEPNTGGASRRGGRGGRLWLGLALSAALIAVVVLGVAIFLRGY